MDRTNIQRFFSRRVILLVGGVLLLPFVSHAQNVFSPYPFQFDQFFSYTSVVNPAATFQEKKTFVQVGYNGFSALSNNLATYFLAARVGLGKDSAFKRHTIGALIVNDKEGVYLNRFKLLGQYAFSVPLSYRTTWTTGIAFGFVNNSLKPNDVTSAQSAYVPDGDIGTWIRQGKFVGGLSLNQFLNKKVVFYNGNYLRRRYATLMAGYKTDIGLYNSVEFYLAGRTGPELYNKYAVGITVYIQKYLIAGIVAKSQNGIIPMVGVKNIPFVKNYMQFLFSYRIPTSNYILAGTGNAELMVEFKFK